MEYFPKTYLEQLPLCLEEEIVPYKPLQRQHKDLKDVLEHDPFTFYKHINNITN
jgi:hypothetical protein